MSLFKQPGNTAPAPSLSSSPPSSRPHRSVRLIVASAARTTTDRRGEVFFVSFLSVHAILTPLSILSVLFTGTPGTTCLWRLVEESRTSPEGDRDQIVDLSPRRRCRGRWCLCSPSPTRMDWCPSSSSLAICLAEEGFVVPSTPFETRHDHRVASLEAHVMFLLAMSRRGDVLCHLVWQTHDPRWQRSSRGQERSCFSRCVWCFADISCTAASRFDTESIDKDLPPHEKRDPSRCDV